MIAISCYTPQYLAKCTTQGLDKYYEMSDLFKAEF